MAWIASRIQLGTTSREHQGSYFQLRLFWIYFCTFLTNTQWTDEKDYLFRDSGHHSLHFSSKSFRCLRRCYKPSAETRKAKLVIGRKKSIFWGLFIPPKRDKYTSFHSRSPLKGLWSCCFLTQHLHTGLCCCEVQLLGSRRCCWPCHAPLTRTL